MRGWTRIAAWLLLMAAGQAARSQTGTTVLQDTVLAADGSAAAGTVVVSWNAFVTAAGTPVAAGSLSTVLGGGGALHVALLPNAGGTPTGSFYTAVYHLSDGTTSREFWVVPVTAGGTVSLAGVRNSVLPTTVAMQTVSKQYVDATVARAVTGVATAQAGGDLSGSYPDPAVTAVHATSGTLDGVTIGGSTPAPGSFNSLTVTAATQLVAAFTTTNSSAYPVVVTGYAPNLPAGGEVAITPGISSGPGEFAWFGLHNTGVPSNNYVVMGLGATTNDLYLYINGKVTGQRNVFDDGNGNGSDAGTRSAVSFHESLNTPASSSAACSTGDFTDDANFHYVCVAANSWKRAALSSF